MGSVGNKYRVHEVAKDFGVPTKQITEILTKYAETPKNHMQVLGDRELSLIFESLTQHNQVSGIQAIYADAAKPAEKKAEPARQQPAARKAEAEKKPGQQAQQPQPEKKPVSRVPQTKVVDTRKATAVNLDKYDEKLQDMAEGRGGSRREQQQGNREKFRNSKKRQNGPVSNRLGNTLRRYVSRSASCGSMCSMVLQKGAAITEAVSSSVNPCRRSR